MVENIQIVPGDASVAVAFATLKEQFALFRNVRPPNIPITGYSFPDVLSLDKLAKKLSASTRATLVDVVDELLDLVQEPVLDDDNDLPEQHYKLLHRATRLRAVAAKVKAEACAAGYAHRIPVTAERAQIEPQIDEIKVITLQLAEHIKLIRVELAKKQTGFSLQLGPVGLTIEGLLGAVNYVLKVTGSDQQVDVSALSGTLTKVASLAGDLLKQAGTSIRSMPAHLSNAFRVVAKKGAELAQRGVQLLESVLRSANERVFGNSSDTAVNPEFAAGANASRNAIADIVVDLGTANTRICRRGHGLVLNDVSVVAADSNEDSEIGFSAGTEALDRLGIADSASMLIYPIRDGAIMSLSGSKSMLSAFLERVRKPSLFSRPITIVGIPYEASDVEQTAIRDAMRTAGARRVVFVYKAIAAAVGAGLPVMRPTGTLLVDVGAGTVEAAVVSLGGIANGHSLRGGSSKINRAIVGHIRERYGILIDINTAEMIKRGTMALVPGRDGQSRPGFEIAGRDLILGGAKRVVLPQAEINIALEDHKSEVVGVVRQVLSETAPALMEDILDTGVVLTGGGAGLTGLVEAIRDGLNIPASVADDPDMCTILGLQRIMENGGKFRNLVLES